MPSQYRASHQHQFTGIASDRSPVVFGMVVIFCKKSKQKHTNTETAPETWHEKRI